MRRQNVDTSIPREVAEKHTNTIGQNVSLDELARLMSLKYNEEHVSTRDPEIRPIPHSGVYLRGELTDHVPHLIPDSQVNNYRQARAAATAV